MILNPQVDIAVGASPVSAILSDNKKSRRLLAAAVSTGRLPRAQGCDEPFGEFPPTAFTGFFKGFRHGFRDFFPGKYVSSQRIMFALTVTGPVQTVFPRVCGGLSLCINEKKLPVIVSGIEP